MHTNPFTLGFAIFAMFFGSGNLVFPLQIGQETNSLWSLGFLGIFISGILLPFAGVFAIKRYKGSYQAFFDELGFGARILVPLVILALLGSFGVVPRCVTVAYGGVSTLFPTLSLWVFAAFFTSLCFLIGLKDSQMLSILGTYITPVKLISLAVIIMYAIYQAPPMVHVDLPLLEAIKCGLVQGYQTMDLFAGFFFSALIFKYIGQNCPPGTSEKDVFWISAKSSLIGASAIALAYAGLVYLGATYKGLLQNIPATHALPEITRHLFGTVSTVVIAIMMIASCLATAVALNTLFANFLRMISKDRVSKTVMLALTTGTAFLMSLLDFSGITAILVPILNVIYPGVILLTLFSLLHPKPHRGKMIVFYGVTAIMIARMFL
ncbi:MAG: branched-chain amino acid transport system II carrier protein [Pseudomonadota bacterium]